MPTSQFTPLEVLERQQNPDGGWGYRGGSSWTEPTAYALLALASATAANSPAARRGFAWLRATRRADGGWPPRPSVPQSTWVTALALLALRQDPLKPVFSGGLEWLLASSGEESSRVFRLRNWLLNPSGGTGEKYHGWPWFPGTAGWVTPTALAILALEKAGPRDPRFVERVRSGREFLLEHRCRDGGWNHGAANALGYAADSYPETTGMALLALHTAPRERVAPGIERARILLRDCHSAQGAAWLRLGLMAHGIPAAEGDRAPGRTCMDWSVCILAQAASEGRNVFL